VLDVDERSRETLPVDLFLALARADDVVERVLPEPVAPEVPELVDVAEPSGSCVVRLERRGTVLPGDESREADSVNRREPEAGREVVDVARAERAGEELAQEGGAGARSPTTKRNGWAASESV